MKFDAALAPMHLQDVPGVAQAAEKMGFDALWTSETQHNPFLPCALIGEHSTRMQTGTAIAVSFARSPADLAYTAWDLAAQTGGRFMLGLGTQVKAHIERRFGMKWPASVVGQLREQIQAIRALWSCWETGEKLNYRGEYYKLSLMSPFFNPGPLPDKIAVGTAIPIYIAGVNTGLARLAGETCEGFHVHPLNSVKYLSEVLLPAIEEGAHKAGRSRADVSVSVTAFVATTPEERNFVRAQVAFYASTPSYRPVFALHGWEDVAQRLSVHATKGEWSQMFGLISDKILETFCVVTDGPGAEKELPTKLKARYDGLADRLTLYSPFVPGEKDELWNSLVEAFQGQPMH